MPKAPRRKAQPTVVIRMGSGGKVVMWEGETFNVTNGDDKSLSTVSANIAGLCGITN